LILVFWWTRSPVSSQISTLNSNTVSFISTLNISINNANILQKTITIVYFFYKFKLHKTT